MSQAVLTKEDVRVTLRRTEVEEEVKDIIEEQANDSPFYVFNLDDVIDKVKLWRKLLPRVTMYYALKCNHHPTVLALMNQMGLCFDCASKGEMERIISLGIPPSRLIFHHPCKLPSHLRFAWDSGVETVVFDSEEELHKIKEHYPTARLVLRMRYDDPTATFSMGDKFGVAPEDARPLLSLAGSLELRIVGTAFHIGSGASNPRVFYEAIAAARNVFDEAVEEGFDPYLLNIGGGFPGNDTELIEQQAVSINDALEQFFPNEDKYKIIAEPGRYLVSSAFTLATMITNCKEVLDECGRLQKFMYYINDSIHMSFTRNLVQRPSPFTSSVLMPKTGSKLHRSDIWGQTLSNDDIISVGSELPRLSCGDWLVWRDMGAYTMALASGFNGFESPRVHLLASEEAWSTLLDMSSQSTKTSAASNEVKDSIILYEKKEKRIH